MVVNNSQKCGFFFLLLLQQVELVLLRFTSGRIIIIPY